MGFGNAVSVQQTAGWYTPAGQKLPLIRTSDSSCVAHQQWRSIAGFLHPLRYGFRPWYLVFALAASALAFFYNGQRGRNCKWLFYWAYPVHIAVLAVLRLLPIM